MKILALLLLVLSASAQTKFNGVSLTTGVKVNGVTNPTSISGASASYGGGGSYLVDEDFEGTGAPASVVASNGTPDYDYATAPAPLSGSKSFSCNSAFEHAEFSLSGTYTDIWFYVLVNASNGVDSNNPGQIQLLDGSNNIQASVHFDTDRVYAAHGTDAASDLGASTTNTTAVWGHYVAETTPGSSADGTLTIYMTKDAAPGTRPTALITRVAGTGDSVQRIRLTCWNTTNAIIMDNLVVDSSEITGTP